MEILQMVLFDYGQTLIAEQKFDGIRGTEAVLQYSGMLLLRERRQRDN